MFLSAPTPSVRLARRTGWEMVSPSRPSTLYLLPDQVRCRKVGSESSDIVIGRFVQLRIPHECSTDVDGPARVSALGLNRKSELTMRGFAPVTYTAAPLGPPLPPNVNRHWRMTLAAVAVGVKENAVPQLPAAGEVLDPSAFVSPAVASSLNEVKTMRFELPTPPTALSVPAIENAGLPDWTLITVCGWMARVTPAGTVIPPVTT